MQITTILQYMTIEEQNNRAEKVVKLLKKCNLSNYVISKYTRIPQNTLGNYKNGLTKPPANPEILLQFLSSDDLLKIENNTVSLN